MNPFSRIHNFYYGHLQHKKQDYFLYLLSYPSCPHEPFPLNLNETSKYLDAKAAAKMAGHTSTVITSHYLINEEERERERLKKVGNEFCLVF